MQKDFEYYTALMQSEEQLSKKGELEVFDAKKLHFKIKFYTEKLSGLWVLLRIYKGERRRKILNKIERIERLLGWYSNREEKLKQMFEEPKKLFTNLPLHRCANKKIEASRELSKKVFSELFALALKKYE